MFSDESLKTILDEEHLELFKTYDSTYGYGLRHKSNYHYHDGFLNGTTSRLQFNEEYSLSLITNKSPGKNIRGQYFDDFEDLVNGIVKCFD